MIFQLLDGKWDLCQAGSDEMIKARVPGCVHLDLMRANKIEDPFYRDNEYRVAWVHESEWEYSRTFAIDSAILACERVFLECDGIDTIGEIYLNDNSLGRVENMYIRHSFDVTAKLRPDKNRILVKLSSPTEWVKPHLANDPLTCLEYSIHGAEYMRKSPCQWGWDWGPKLPSMGIWRSIRLVGYDVARITPTYLTG